ncbi:hypothetical protein [Thermoactinomyces mirandus]|uniref:Uncharacterized protein n=1 Tax=Thermoactinomyces mirandus TaxID=2756294 RepID=A0A7W1XPB9_9BACL|nr:hypothetical protein [Thermoactinomyces mirandus]MBA4600807.1 hypothetical protein [Thermoactinomyces mirandus]
MKREIVLQLDYQAKQILLNALKSHKTIRKVEINRNSKKNLPSYFDEALILEDLMSQVNEQWNKALPSSSSSQPRS